MTDDQIFSKNLLDVLNDTKFMTLATVCADGSPRATPLGWFAFDAGERRLVFDNRLGTVHAENLARDSRCFITIVNYDQDHSRSVNIKTVAHKLVGSEYDAAKKLILDRGLNVSDDIFAAPIGEVDMEKTQVGFSYRKGNPRFYCYMIYEGAENDRILY
ncbi:pyridoxamine 5'-phosphate oxidase family protein [Candidatus Saccharibacteria bacterium]|nr:pyridoxamine 5'-phosphate oxidase family protein [Candidatus Saccharibacteria bacterium]